MRWFFASLFPAQKPSPNGGRRHRQRALPQLEVLEERTLLNNRFVVPIGVPTDNTTTFSSLSAALTTPGLSANDTIQIEPGSSPGNVTNANLTGPGVPGLTIAGDPSAVLSSIPQFTVSDAVTLGAAETGFTLRNVNVGLLDSGTLAFNSCSTNITDSSLVDISSGALYGLSFLPESASNINNFLSNSTLTTLTDVGLLVNVSPGTGSNCSNTITGNTFVASETNVIGGALLGYTNPIASTVAAADQVSNNTFIGNVGSNLTALFEDTATATGVTLQGNTFSDPDSNMVGIRLDNSANTATQTTSLNDNLMNMTGAGTFGVAVYGGSTGSVTTVFLQANEIRTGPGISSSTGNGGTALVIYTATDPTGTVNVFAQANNLQNNSIGVEIVLHTSTSAANLRVDLGGGLSGSKGGNDFRDLPTAGTHQGPILVEGSNPAAGLSVNAQDDLFSSTTGLAFVAGGINGVSVITSNPLTGNAAFVETMYIDLFHRFGDTTNAKDAGYWVTLLNNNTMTQAQVANSLVHSVEGLGNLVNGLYQKFLNRAADASGLGFFVNLLQTGTTLEQVISRIVASQEFANLTLNNANFVQTLINKLLGRFSASSEVAYYVSQLSIVGKAGVASEVMSTAEFRQDAVQELYGFQLPPASSVLDLLSPLLHRTAAPLMGDVNYWAISTKDLLTIMTGFAGTGDYFTNG